MEHFRETLYKKNQYNIFINHMVLGFQKVSEEDSFCIQLLGLYYL